MNVFMIMKVAVRAIWRNKTRSSLTMLGIIFGIAAVIVVIPVLVKICRLAREEVA